MLFRAGGAAAVLSLAVSGGAYAAVAAQDEQGGLGGNTLAALGGEANGAPAGEAVTVADDGAATVTTVTEETTQAHGKTEKPSASVPEGETRVETEGVDGVVRTTYQVTSVDGKETSRVEISSVVVTQAVDEVVLVGTGSASAPAESGSTSAPTDSGATEAPASTSTTEQAPAPAADSSAGTTPEGAKAIARSMMAGYGWGDSEFSCLESLWERESNWNYQAQNPSSGAYGIPQSLPGDKMASVSSDWATNPTTQITWGLGYISGRYGTPCAAWAHSESVGWY